MSNEIDRWFAAEILPYEGALTRYLRRVCLNQAEVPDFRQEVYLRVYEGAACGLPRSAKAFLFAIARNLIVDCVRRKRIVSIDYTQDLESLNVLVDEISPEHRISAREELRRLSAALDQLPDDCRSVIWLRRVEGLSQRQAAERLGMCEGTIESHLCRGLRALMKAVFDAGPPQGAQAAMKRPDRGNEHG